MSLGLFSGETDPREATMQTVCKLLAELSAIIMVFMTNVLRTAILPLTEVRDIFMDKRCTLPNLVRIGESMYIKDKKRYTYRSLSLHTHTQISQSSSSAIEGAEDKNKLPPSRTSVRDEHRPPFKYQRSDGVRLQPAFLAPCTYI